MKKLLRLFSLFVVSFMLMTTGLDAQTILCVDRDGGDDTSVDGFTNTWHQIQWALEANGYAYSYYDAADDDDGPPYDTLAMYDIVIWFTGEAWSGSSTLSENDESALSDWLYANDGKLFLNAQDYLYDRYESLGTFEPDMFPSFALGIDEVVQDV